MLAVVAVALLGVVLATAVQCQVTTDAQCVSPVAVTLESTRNRNHKGTWVTKVGLEHRKNSGPWVVRTDVCEGADTVRILTTISSTAGSPREIPAGYELFPGVGYYKFHPNGTTWPRARHTCAQEGAHLAIINSETEADVIVQLFARFPKPLISAGGNDDWAWLGVHEMGVDGEYYTIFGDSLNATGFIRWVTKQPDDKGVNDAVLAYRLSGGLGDSSPSWIAAFICEMEL